MKLEDIPEGRPIGFANAEFFALVDADRDLWARRLQSVKAFEASVGKRRNTGTVATAPRTASHKATKPEPYQVKRSPQLWRPLLRDESRRAWNTVNGDAWHLYWDYQIDPRSAPELEEYRAFGRELARLSFGNIRRAADALGVAVELSPAPEAKQSAEDRNACASWMQFRDGSTRIEVYGNYDIGKQDGVLCHELGHHAAESRHKSDSTAVAELRAQAVAVGFANQSYSRF